MRERIGDMSSTYGGCLAVYVPEYAASPLVCLLCVYHVFAILH